MNRMRIFGIAATAATLAVGGCGDDGEPIVEPVEVTDPYCTENENWFEELSVTADYSSDGSGAVAVTFEPTHDVVDMDGLMHISGADIESLVYDGHTLWMVLLPFEDDGEIILTGAVDCTTETQPLSLTIRLAPDDETVTFELTYTDGEMSDAGDDAGDPSDAGV